MSIESLSHFLFFQESERDLQILENFIEVLSSKDAAYMVDLDGTISNSPQHMVNKLNHDIRLNNESLGINNFRKRYRVVDINRMDAIRTWAMESGMPSDQAAMAEQRWYQDEPLLASKPYRLAIPLMRKIHGHVGSEKLKTLTAREPHLVEGTKKWHKRWIPFVKGENILIRKPGESIDHVEFKIRNIVDEAKKSKYVIVLEDSGTNTEHVLRYCDEHGIDNVYCILLPLGQTQPRFNHDRLLILRREPFEDQDIESMYSVITESVAQY